MIKYGHQEMERIAEDIKRQLKEGKTAILTPAPDYFKIVGRNEVEGGYFPMDDYSEHISSASKPPDTPARIKATQVSPILKYFKPMHSHARLAVITRPFDDLAHTLEEKLPVGAEKSVALRKLLEAKDAAVRAYKDKLGVTDA
jgi:hypothetical protein